MKPDDSAQAVQIREALETLRVAMGDRYRAEYEAMLAYWTRSASATRALSEGR